MSSPQSLIAIHGSADRAALDLQQSILTAIETQTLQARVASGLVSAQLEGLREQLIAIRTDLREESIWHKAWTGLRRFLALHFGVV